MRGEEVESRILSARHKKDSDFNLSNVLLGQLGLAGMEIAKDKSGTKKPLSFRDVVRLCIVDETSIQSETSPAESGDITLAPIERHVLKYMLTGEADAAIIPPPKTKDYDTGRKAQVRMLDEINLDTTKET